jgi:predicted metalloendopeptidase
MQQLNALHAETLHAETLHALSVKEIERFVHTPLTKIKSKIQAIIHTPRDGSDWVRNVTRRDTWAFAAQEIHQDNISLPAWVQNLTTPTAKFGAVPPWAANLTDASISPCDDFYTYACGEWEKNVVIPKDKTEIMYTFEKATDRIADLMKNFLQSDRGKAGTLYRSCTDVKTIDARGLAPYADDETVNKVEAVKDEHSLMLALASISRINGNALFAFSVDADSADPTKYAFYLNQAGLSLPDQTMYTNPKMKPLVGAYAQEQVKIFQMVGVSAADAANWSKASMELEAEIAKITTPPTQARSATGAKAYTMAELINATGLKWDVFFEGLGKAVGKDRAEIRSFSSMQYFQSISKMIKTVPMSHFRAYLQWQLLMLLIGHLPEKYVNAKLAINKDLFGQAKFPPRWRMCHDTLASTVPQLLSRLYVEKAYNEHSGEMATHMLRQVQKAFHDLVSSAKWIEPVRAAALSKLRHMFLEVGHPAKWQGFSPTVDQKEWYENSIKMAKWAVETALAKLGSTVNRRSWGDSGPMEVNAAYQSHVNGLFIPAGVLQAPIYSSEFPIGWNFGSLGVLMGHEMTHGFDDQGRRYDEKGRLKDWWTANVTAEYSARAKCIGDYYSTYKVYGKPVNGQLTMGENIADNGGLRIAWEALMRVVRMIQSDQTAASRSGKQMVDSVVGKQFFLAWAQMWCTKIPKKSALLRLNTDVHAPDSVRVNAPLSQFPEFASIFGCKAGTKMNPKAPRCRLW